MDFDFEDILKEFGISTEEEEKASVPETPVPEEDAEPVEAPETDSEPERALPDETESGKEGFPPEEDEFDFFWPEPEPERAEPVQRNYDPEKYPDAVKAREKKRAREEREAASQAARRKREADKLRREQERREAELARREAEEARRQEEQARAEETLFIDDSPTNVEVANRLGIQTLCPRNNEDWTGMLLDKLKK